MGADVGGGAVGEMSTVVKSPGTPPPSQGRGRRRGWLRGEFNPLLVKELRGRMRGARAFVVLTVYLLLLSGFTAIIYYAYSASVRGPSGGGGMAYLGKVVFASVVLLEIFMVTFITPAFTAGAISGERERKTYELLRTTLLPARKLVAGKLTSALTYMFLLILAAVPLESLAFVLGGVVVEELVLALVILLVTAFAFATIGIFFSSLVRTTLLSTVLAYATALLATVGLPILLTISAALLDSFAYGYSSPGPSWVVQAITNYALYLTAGLSPITAAIFTEVTLEEESTIWFFWESVGSGHRILIPSAWIVYAVFYLALALVLLLVTVLRVRRQETR
ncbi:MAG: ABC transporter permease [Chloroflexota bacterium]|nr:ABC transporter permease [Chloroflexota bacterium]